MLSAGSPAKFLHIKETGSSGSFTKAAKVLRDVKKSILPVAKECARPPPLQIRHHQNGRGPTITTGSTSLQFWRLAKCVSMNFRSLVS